MESISGMLIPIGTIVLIILVQISFWFPTGTKQRAIDDDQFTTNTTATATATATTPSKDQLLDTREPSKLKEARPPSGNRFTRIAQTIPPENFQCIFITDDQQSSSKNEETSNKSAKELKSSETPNNNSTLGDKEDDGIKKGRVWKCACELGFLPAGMLKTFGNAEAMMRLGVGQCYHKQT